jgi:sulfite reductase (ferredoxin)
VGEDSTHFGDEALQLLKFHGSYQQDHRDLRKGKDRHWMFMIRGRLPGGKMTPEQYLAVDAIADEYGDGTIRVTTRQTFQLYGIIKKNLRPTIRKINDSLITTFATCGDVVRNVMANPAPDVDGRQAKVQAFADELSDILLPATKAYHEIWLDGEILFSGADQTLNQPIDNHASGPRVNDIRLNDHPTPDQNTPSGLNDNGVQEYTASGNNGRNDKTNPSTEKDDLYSRHYLPRKFKIGVTVPRDNSIDLYTQDIGLVAIFNDRHEIEGFNIVIGGGMGMHHKKPETFPRLGDHLGYVRAGQIVDVIKGIVGIQRDFGNRENRKRARMKYLIEDIGIDAFYRELTDRIGFELEAFRPLPAFEPELYLGWHRQSDGKWFLGLSVENGRIKDDANLRLKTVLHLLVRDYRLEVRLTANHNILLTGISVDDKDQVDAILRAHGVLPGNELSNVLKFAMACPALPTCGLAITEAERVFPKVVRDLEKVITQLGLDDEQISVRMTGCPNGCARPYVADIGFVGRSLDKYTIFIGGNPAGTRLNQVYKDLVPLDELVSEVRPLLEHYSEYKLDRESFGDFWTRIGIKEAGQIPV